MIKVVYQKKKNKQDLFQLSVLQKSFSFCVAKAIFCATLFKNLFSFDYFSTKEKPAQTSFYKKLAIQKKKNKILLADN